MAAEIAALRGDESTVLREIRSLHEQYPLCCACRGKKSLTELEDRLLAYVIALMRGEPASAPACSAGQWQDLLASLGCHRINPFLYWRIRKNLRGSSFPELFLGTLENDYANSAQSCLIEDKQLAGISSALAEARVDFLVLKGAALSRTTYPAPFLRHGSDLDLLIRPADVRKARKALESAGYLCHYPAYDISPGYFVEEKFTYKDSKNCFSAVEVHWNQAYPPFSRSLETEGFFRRSARARAGKAEVRVMDPVDAFAFTAFHTIAHHWDNVRLSWITDLGLLARELAEAGQWEELRRRYPEPWAGLMLRPALRMAELWTGAEIPPGLPDTWPEPDHRVKEAFEKIRKKGLGLSDHLRASWPAGAPLAEKYRLLKYFILPPEPVVRREFCIAENVPLPLAHVKRWLYVAGWNYRK